MAECIPASARGRDELAINAAQFFRAKSETLQFALPLLNKPPELLQHIEKDMVLPSYDDAVWVSTSDSTLLPTTVQTGKTGYDLCSVSERSEDGTAYFPYTNATYNSETGEVTFPVQSKAGVEYSIDFYTDGTSLQCFGDLRHKMRGCDKVDVVRPLKYEFFKNFTQSADGDPCAEISRTDVTVLAKNTAK